jgi:hypothetical protein
MALRQFLGQAFNEGTPLATANHTFKSPTINNQAPQEPGAAGVAGQAYSSIDVVVHITAVTGSSAAITAQLFGSTDGVDFEAIGSASSSLTAAGLTTLSNTNVDVPFLQVQVVESNTTTPSVTCNVNVYGF